MQFHHNIICTIRYVVFIVFFNLSTLSISFYQKKLACWTKSHFLNWYVRHNASWTYRNKLKYNVNQNDITWGPGTDPEVTMHYDDVTMSAIASQITSLTIVYSTVYPGADQSKHQSFTSLAFVWGIHRGPVNSPHKWPVTRKMFPFDDVIMAKKVWNHSKCIRIFSIPGQKTGHRLNWCFFREIMLFSATGASW